MARETPELEKRLRTTDLVGRVKEVTKDKVISALLSRASTSEEETARWVCEFTHKAFREKKYLFAEEIVETLKSCARDDLPCDLSERPPSLYWKALWGI